MSSSVVGVLIRTRQLLLLAFCTYKKKMRKSTTEDSVFLNDNQANFPSSSDCSPLNSADSIGSDFLKWVIFHWLWAFCTWCLAKSKSNNIIYNYNAYQLVKPQTIMNNNTNRNYNFIGDKWFFLVIFYLITFFTIYLYYKAWNQMYIN